MPKQWEIWYAKFAYEENPNITKLRPVLIIENRDSFPISVVKITKKEPRQGFWGEYRIFHWEETKLAFPSTIRLSKMLKLSEHDFVHKIGSLEPFDIVEIQKILMSSK